MIMWLFSRGFKHGEVQMPTGLGESYEPGRQYIQVTWRDAEAGDLDQVQTPEGRRLALEFLNDLESKLPQEWGISTVKITGIGWMILEPSTAQNTHGALISVTQFTPLRVVSGQEIAAEFATPGMESSLAVLIQPWSGPYATPPWDDFIKTLVAWPHMIY